MTAPVPVVPVTAAAQEAWAVGQLLLGCLCTNLAATVAGAVCRCSMMSGDQPVADICTAPALGSGNGQAWVRLVQVYMSREFPRPAIDIYTCADGFWAAEYEIGVLRCGVTPDDEGQPPTAAQLNDEAAMCYDDMAALRLVAECCLPGGIPRIPTAYTPMAGGGCVGGRLTVVAQLVPGPIAGLGGS